MFHKKKQKRSLSRTLRQLKHKRFLSGAHFLKQNKKIPFWNALPKAKQNRFLSGTRRLVSLALNLSPSLFDSFLFRKEKNVAFDVFLLFFFLWLAQVTRCARADAACERRPATSTRPASSWSGAGTSGARGSWNGVRYTRFMDFRKKNSFSRCFQLD